MIDIISDFAATHSTYEILSWTTIIFCIGYIIIVLIAYAAQAACGVPYEKMQLPKFPKLRYPKYRRWYW